MRRHLISRPAPLIIAALLLLIALRPPCPAAEREITLGTLAHAKELFAYPNEGHEDQTPLQTMQHYLGSSMKREQLPGYGATVRLENGLCMLRFAGPDHALVDRLASRYERFFAAGLKTAQTDIVAAGWYAQMISDPDGDPHAALAKATAFWKREEQQPTLLKLVRKNARISAPFAEPSTAAIEELLKLSPGDEEQDRMEREFHEADVAWPADE